MEVREAKTAQERAAVYRLRYEVYVREMERPQRYADHEGRQIVEPLDDTGTVLYAIGGNDEVIGTVRINFTRAGDLGEYESLYQMKRLPSHPIDTSITTKFMVHPDHRGGRAAVALTAAVYTYALERGIRYNVMDCNPPLVRFFRNLGFKTFLPCIDHDEYGKVVGMLLDLHDIDHLQARNSPFVPYFHAWQDRQANIATA